MNRVLLLRLVLGLKAKDLAKSAGISIAMLSMIESNKREPSITTYRKLAACLDVPLSILVEDMIQDKEAKRIATAISNVEAALTYLEKVLP